MASCPNVAAHFIGVIAAVRKVAVPSAVRIPAKPCGARAAILVNVVLRRARVACRSGPSIPAHTGAACCYCAGDADSMIVAVRCSVAQKGTVRVATISIGACAAVGIDVEPRGTRITSGALPGVGAGTCAPRHPSPTDTVGMPRAVPRNGARLGTVGIPSVAGCTRTASIALVVLRRTSLAAIASPLISAVANAARKLCPCHTARIGAHTIDGPIAIVVDTVGIAGVADVSPSGVATRAIVEDVELDIAVLALRSAPTVSARAVTSCADNSYRCRMVTAVVGDGAEGLCLS